MSELVSEDVEQPTTAHPTGHSTGHPGVDEVLASLTDLDSRPAAEHVAVFENAQERLRAALSEAADDGAGNDGSGNDGASGDVSTDA
jgi:hypothetical protein